MTPSRGCSPPVGRAGNRRAQSLCLLLALMCSVMRVETRRLHHPAQPRDVRLDTEAAFSPLGFFFFSSSFLFPLALPPSLPPSFSPSLLHSLPPASQTPYTRQAGKRRLMQSDRHAHGHRDTCGCGQVAGETEGQVGADRVGGGGVGEGGADGGKAVRAAEVSHQHTDIWMKQTAPLIRGRRRSCPSHTHKQVITRPDPPPQQVVALLSFQYIRLHFLTKCQSTEIISCSVVFNNNTTTFRQWEMCLFC